MLAQWLKGACRRWGFDPSLVQWAERIESVVCKCFSNQRFYERHWHTIYTLAATGPSVPNEKLDEDDDAESYTVSDNESILR